MEHDPKSLVRFGVFEADLETGELRKHGVRLRLQEKPFQILVCLLERPNRLVRREQLQARLWGDETFVDFEGSLNAAIRKLRSVLGDSASSPRFVETLPRRGYRFIAPVREAEVRRPERQAPELSLAVMPFQSTGGAQDYLGDGLTEEVLAAATQIEGLRVASRSSVFHYKNKAFDLREAGEALAVSYLLEGGVRQSGERLRISVELTEVATGYIVWAKRYDRDATDLFAWQDELAGAIAQRLRAEFQPRSAAAGEPDAGAHELYLQGRYQWNRWTPDGWRRALGYFQDAVKQSPEYAQAWAGLARTHSALGGFGLAAPRAAFQSAREAAERAVELAPELADGHGALAECLALYDWDWEAAEAQFERALELDPNDSIARDAYAACCLVPQGRFAEAREHLRSALRTDPLSPRVHSYLGLTEFLDARPRDAAAALERALELDPGYGFAAQWLSLVRAVTGQAREAETVLRRMALADRDPATLGFLGFALATAGDRRGAEELLAELETAGGTPFHGCLIEAALGRSNAVRGRIEQMREMRDPHLPLALVVPAIRDAS